MTNNLIIKDANGSNVTLHTIEDATSVHFNQSIPTDIANNTATVVSGGQPVASGMGALVVAQRDALPSGTNLLGGVSVRGISDVSVSPNGLNIPVSIAPLGFNVPVSVAGTLTVGTHAVTQSGSWAITSVNSRVAVSVENTNNIAVSLAPLSFNVPVSVHPVTQSGTWSVGLTAGTALVGAVSISPNGLNIPVSLAPLGFNVPVSVHPVTQSGTWNVGLNAGTALVGAVSISPNGLNIPVSVANTINVATHAVTQSGTWNVAAVTSINSIVKVSIEGSLTVTGGSMLQTVGAAVTAEGYPMLGSDGTLARRLLTTTGGALVVHVSNAQPTPSGISMLQTVGAAVTTQGYPMLGTDGTNARGLLTTTGGALVVHISNALPAAGASMLQTVGAAVTTEGYPMLGSDGTNARRLLTTTGGALVVHVSNSQPAVATSIAGVVSVVPDGTTNWPVSVANTINVATHAVTQSGTWNVNAITSINSRVGVSVENTNNIAVSVAGSITVGTHAVTQSGTWNVAAITSINSRVGVSVENTNNIAVSVAGTPAVTQSGTWTVQPGNTVNTTPWLVSVNGTTAVSVAAGRVSVNQIVSVTPNHAIGSAIGANAMPIGGTDGTNLRALLVDALGALQVTGMVTNAEASFTRPADTTAYASGDLVGNSTTAGSVTPLSFNVSKFSTGGGAIIVRRARIVKSLGILTNAQFRLHLYNTSNGATNQGVSVANGDNAAYQATKVSNYLGYMSVTMEVSHSNGAVGWTEPVRGMEMNPVLAAGQFTIQGLLEARAAYTPGNTERFNVTLEVYQE